MSRPENICPGADCSWPAMEMRVFLCCLIVAAHWADCSGSPSTCDEVRKVFQSKQMGPVKWIPEKPRIGSDLQVCVSKNLTCCNRKMEDRYQAAAHLDFQSLLQTTSSSLKLLISRNVAVFQEMFESLVKQAETHTTALFLGTYGDVADKASGAVEDLFADISLFVQGSELQMDDSVRRFFDRLFPPVHLHLLDPELEGGGLTRSECVRAAGGHLAPFGGLPRQLGRELSRTALPGRVFLQALNLAIEVLNTTEHLPYARECRRALLKALYCPHCQGLIRSKPCTGYCLNIMRGCLASVAEVDPHWREFVRSLEELSAGMQGAHDLERVLLGVPSLIGEAIAHAWRNRQKLSTQVRRMCGVPGGTPAQLAREKGGGPAPPRVPPPSTKDTFNSKRREFISSLRLHRTFYAGLADQLCEAASGDDPSCWNGADVVKSYTLRVVGSGIKAQAQNPEVRVKGLDPVISQVIDKLKHVNQLLQGKPIPKYGTLDRIETGSGDCDDEDGCTASGDGEVETIAKVSEWTPDKLDDPRQDMPQTDGYKTGGVSATGGMAHGGGSLSTQLALGWLCALMLLQW